MVMVVIIVSILDNLANSNLTLLLTLKQQKFIPNHSQPSIPATCSKLMLSLTQIPSAKLIFMPGLAP